MLAEAGERAEIVRFVVLDDEERARFDESGGKDCAGNVGESVHVVGRVGEDEIEALGRCRDVAQGVAADEGVCGISELFRHFCDETLLGGGFLDGDYAAATARKKLEADGARAGEKVERVDVLEVDIVFDDVEDVLSREVGCRARGDVCGYVETSASVFSSYYSHKGRSISGKGALKASRPARRAAEGKISGMTRAA